MKRSVNFLIVTAAVMISMSSPAFAGTWKSNQTGWYWEEDDGTYPVSSWQWLDGNQDGISECYYFNEEGYLLTNTTTPDDYQVNADGRWVVNGEVQTRGNGTNWQEARAQYETALNNTNQLNDFESNARIEMNMSAAGETYTMTMDMNMKMAYRKSSKIKYLANVRYYTDEQSQTMTMFYTQGSCYMDADGMKIKMAMPLDDLLSSTGGGIQESKYLEDIHVSEDNKGNKTFTFVCSTHGVEALLNSMGTEMSSLVSLDNIKIRDYKGTVTVNTAGYITSSSVVLNYDAAINELPISYDIKMDIGYVNPGQQVFFSLPSTEGFTEY